MIRIDVATSFRTTTLILFAVGLLAPAAAQPASDEPQRLQINVNDRSGNPVPCRIHLSDSAGNPQRAQGQPFWNDHFTCSGRVAIDLPAGIYRYEIEHGPCFQRRHGNIEVETGTSNELDVVLSPLIDLRRDGWYGGDLHVHRPVDEMENLMRAEDLDFASVITWWNNRNAWRDTDPPRQTTRRFDGHRIYNVMAGEDEREGGALLFLGLRKPLDLSASSREVPSPMRFVTEARQRTTKVWIDIEKPFWWDVPTWLASGQMNSIGIANNHMGRSEMLANEAWGRPRDAERLPPPRGNGYWTQEIYYQMLDSGLRLPPSAGSASGVLPNPVGYNRVYVHLDDGEAFTRQSWFAALARGRAFVTNGPLLIARAGGHLPGHQFRVTDRTAHRIALDISLTSLDRVEALQVIQNGAVTATLPCDAARQQRHRVEIQLDRPGWFLVRAITDLPHTFRFASTAPWFVASSSDDTRISQSACRFFLDWTRQRIDRIESNVSELQARQAVLRPHRQAEAFWQQRRGQANAD
jgi:hypothetical protein